MEVNNDDIILDVETQNDLKHLINIINESRIRLQLILRTYVRAKDKKGDYSINKDVTKLERVEKDG